MPRRVNAKIPAIDKGMRWLEEMKAANQIPRDTVFRANPLAWQVVARWLIIFGVLLFAALWILRQVCRTFRFMIARARGANPDISPGFVAKRRRCQ